MERKKLLKGSFLGGISLVLSGCMAVPMIATAGCGALAMGSASILGHQNKPEPSLTPLEIEALQTREYEASKARIFSSVISVLQNLGYTISLADQTSGLIKAKSLLKSSDHMNVTAFIESERKKTKLRLSFVKIVKTTYRHHGSEKDSTQVLDATLYQNAFEQIDSELVVRSTG